MHYVYFIFKIILNYIMYTKHFSKVTLSYKLATLITKCYLATQY